MVRRLQTHRQSRGFTILEVLMVLALLAIIAAFMLMGFRQYMAYQQYTQEVQLVRLTLQESQTSARLSVGGVAHGVRIDTSSLTQFEGGTYSSTDPDNVVTTLKSITLSPSLSGGVSEVVFTPLSGYPSAAGTITVTGRTYSQTSAIELTAGGVVQ